MKFLTKFLDVHVFIILGTGCFFSDLHFRLYLLMTMSSAAVRGTFMRSPSHRGENGNITYNLSFFPAKMGKGR